MQIRQSVYIAQGGGHQDCGEVVTSLWPLSSSWAPSPEPRGTGLHRLNLLNLLLRCEAIDELMVGMGNTVALAYDDGCEYLL